MIKYEWRDSLSPAESAELADMLQRAAVYDAEREFSTIDFADVERSMAQEDHSTRHLVIWMLPRQTTMDGAGDPERIAGLLRLVFESDDVADATVVIEPDLRSLGIMTLLLEQVGVDTTSTDGWAGTGARTVTSWARGTHPAADRLANRFLIPHTRRVWKLIRGTAPIDTADSRTLLEKLEEPALRELDWAPVAAFTGAVYGLRAGGEVIGVVALDLRNVESEEFGTCATIKYAATASDTDPRTRRWLLEGAADAAGRAGCSGVIVYVDSDDLGAVHACRLAGFQHDRTDMRYQLGGR